MRHYKSDAQIDWEHDVDKERDRLIEAGEPPWVAAEQAVKNVRQRRRNAAMRNQILTIAPDGPTLIHRRTNSNGRSNW